MGKLKFFAITMVVALLSACSGGDDNTLVTDVVGGPGGTTIAGVAILTLLTSSPQMPSDGAGNATITALARDINNNVMEGVPVLFTSDSGSLVITQPATTDINGQLTATLSTAGDRTNRTITVTGTADMIQSTVTVNVIGTTLTLNGPANLPLGDVGSYNIVLTDAGNNGIGGVSVAITAGNTISATPLTTDADGLASFDLTASAGGADTVEAQGLGLIASQALTVSADVFSFTAPAAATEIPLNTNQSVTVNWQQSGAAVVGQPISFSSTRGTVSASPVNTDASGNASITVSANNAGPAVITAANANNTITQLVVEFVATQADTVELQANPRTVAPQEQSAITALVRDPAGNLVKNQVVNFTLTDVTGGSLSVAQAITNSQGRAQTFYTASTQTSASGGVQIDATVQGTLVTDTVSLTVAQRALFLSIGTGNSIEEPNDAQYRVEFAVQVTDSQGAGVAGATVQVNVLSEQYMKGWREFPLGGNGWITVVSAVCLDEDVDRDGVLDVGEDFNSSGLLEAGNIATVAVQGAGGGTFTSDANGFGLVDLFYPQEFAGYVSVTMEATASVQGTEFAESTTFTLTGSSSDFNNQNIAPPGIVSRFGTGTLCSNTL